VRLLATMQVPIVAPCLSCRHLGASVRRTSSWVSGTSTHLDRFHATPHRDAHIAPSQSG